jgi:hypothetical protein
MDLELASPGGVSDSVSLNSGIFSPKFSSNGVGILE